MSIPSLGAPADGGRLSVVYLIDSLAPGGAERSLVDMAPHLLANGVDLRVAVLHDRQGLAGELRQHGVPVEATGGGGRVSWLAGFVRLLGRHQPQLVHTTLFESDLVGRTAAAVRRVPVVSTFATEAYGPQQYSEEGVSKLKLRGAQLADAASARLVRRFHAVSQSAAEVCVSSLRLPRDRVEVIPRGRDLARLGVPSPARRRQARERLGIPPDAPVLLALSRQEPQKGLDLALRALPVVNRAYPGALLLIAGREGKATPGLRSLAAELGIGSRVRILGQRDDVGDLLCAADVFALASRREGLPGSVLEAMAMKVPIVASDLPAVREAVPDEAHALLFPAGDPAALGHALIATLQDPDAAERRAAASFTRFKERFDIASVSAAMARFYQRALAGWNANPSGRGRFA